MSNVLETKSLCKVYGKGPTSFYALKDVSLSVKNGEFVAIMGASGSGKSTLLHMLSGLDRPSSGEVLIESQVLNNLTDSETTRVRREKVGFIFQSYNLIPVLSAQENVTIPLLLAGYKKKDLQEKAAKLLNLVGLGDRLTHRPSELSGGQQQRVAIARALISAPKIIMADEPTGSLDSKTSQEILILLRNFCNQFSQSFVVVTHDVKVASYAHRVIFMQDGKFVHELDLTLSTNPNQDISNTWQQIEEVIA